MFCSVFKEEEFKYRKGLRKIAITVVEEKQFAFALYSK